MTHTDQNARELLDDCRSYLSTLNCKAAENLEDRIISALQAPVAPASEDVHDLPRYGLMWNGETNPVSVPMDDGYWTPWHLAVASQRPTPQPADASVQQNASDRTQGALSSIDCTLDADVSEDELKPCPFCGGDATEIRRGEMETKYGLKCFCEVGCINPDCQVRPSPRLFKSFLFGRKAEFLTKELRYVKTEYTDIERVQTMKKAIHNCYLAWNTRAKSDERVVSREDARAALIELNCKFKSNEFWLETIRSLLKHHSKEQK